MPNPNITVMEVDASAEWHKNEIQVSDHVCLIIAMSAAAGASSTEANNLNDRESRTELNTHANMPVIGRNLVILAQHNKTVEV